MSAYAIPREHSRLNSDLTRVSCVTPCGSYPAIQVEIPATKPSMMAQAQPDLDFCELSEPTLVKAKVVGSINPAIRLENEHQATVAISHSTGPHRSTTGAKVFTEPFPVNRLELQKLQWAYHCATDIQSEEDFCVFFENLKQLDKCCFASFGGQILDAINNRETPESLVDFDDRYLVLIQLLAHADLATAKNFHERAEKLWMSFANSLVRYTRLKTALKNTQSCLNNQRAAGAKLYRVSPLMYRGVREQLINAANINKELKSLDETEAVQWYIPLDKTYHRSFQRFVTADDKSSADVKWINSTNETPVDLFTVLSVPQARVCRAPTGITWNQDGRFQFRYTNSDMYHYFRMSGFAAFSPVTRHVELAYFLPRIGNRNYYHSLVDKLPALHGYKLLGLSCPIVSSYELDDTERHFCEQLGINPDDIICDINGELIATRGIIPDVEGLRAPFFDYCRTRPVEKTRYGDKIYITRANSNERPLVNEVDVQKLMLTHGFGIVAMENYSLQEQMAIARNAKIIVSPHGAGLSNMVFSPKGTAIVELIPDRYMTPLFKQLAIDCNHRYSCLLGSVDSKSEHIESTLSWRIDLQKLESLLLKTHDLQDC